MHDTASQIIVKNNDTESSPCINHFSSRRRTILENNKKQPLQQPQQQPPQQQQQQQQYRSVFLLSSFNEYRSVVFQSHLSPVWIVTCSMYSPFWKTYLLVSPNLELHLFELLLVVVIIELLITIHNYSMIITSSVFKYTFISIHFISITSIYTSILHKYT